MSGIGLTAAEKVQVENDARDIIIAADTTALIYRPQVEGEDTFDGPYDSDTDFIDGVPIDFQIEPQADVLEPNSDAIGDVFPETDVKKKDIIVVDALEYRVRHKKPFTAFGVHTYTRLHVENIKS